MTVHPLSLTHSTALPIIYPTRGGRAPLPRSVPREMPVQPQTDRRRARLTCAQRVALLEMQKAKRFTNRELSEIAGVHETTVSLWRKQHGYVGRRGRRPLLSPEDQDALFVLQQEEAATDRELADLAGVTVSTIRNWRAARQEKTTSISRRQVVIERPDGTILRLDLTTEEMTRFIDFKAHA